MVAVPSAASLSPSFFTICVRIGNERAKRRVAKGSVKHPGIKHVGRAMTLNLPQTLYDLNHHHLASSSSSA